MASMAEKRMKGRMVAAGFYRPSGTKRWQNNTLGIAVQSMYWQGRCIYTAVDYVTPQAAPFVSLDEACEKALEYAAQRKGQSDGTGNKD